jgi:hypothetical protein
MEALTETKTAVKDNFAGNHTTAESDYWQRQGPVIGLKVYMSLLRSHERSLAARRRHEEGR